MEEPKSNIAFRERFRILSGLVEGFTWNPDTLSFPVTVDLAARRVGKAFDGEPACSTYSIVQMPTGELNLVMYHGDSYEVTRITDMLYNMPIVTPSEVEEFRKAFISQGAVPA